jgi:hypothetical protein
MAPSKPKTPRETKAHCNECGGQKKHDMLFSYVSKMDELLFGDDGELSLELEHVVTSECLQCRGCGLVCFRQSTSIDGDDPVVIQHPSPVSRRRPEWTWGLPEVIKTLVGEVYRALAADSRILGMMGARGLIDLVLQNKVGGQGGYAQRLARLESSGVVSKGEREVLETALEAGHAASHRAYLPTVKDLNHVMDIVEHLIHSLYVLPGVAAEIKKRTPEREGPQNRREKIVPINRNAAT